MAISNLMCRSFGQPRLSLPQCSFLSVHLSHSHRVFPIVWKPWRLVVIVSCCSVSTVDLATAVGLSCCDEVGVWLRLRVRRERQGGREEMRWSENDFHSQMQERRGKHFNLDHVTSHFSTGFNLSPGWGEVCHSSNWPLDYDVIFITSG